MKSFINDFIHAAIFAVIISSPMVAYFLIYM
jgi:hypothetical protein